MTGGQDSDLKLNSPLLLWKELTNKTHFKRATALTLVVTLVLCQSFVTETPLTQVVSKLQRYMSEPEKLTLTLGDAKLPRAAHLSVQGTVTLNGMTASNGATVFSGAGVQTKEDGSAILSFGTMGQVELTSASDFTLAVEGTTLGGRRAVRQCAAPAANHGVWLEIRSECQTGLARQPLPTVRRT